MKNCDACGIQFTPKNQRQRFCTSKCGLASVKMHSGPCIICGGPITGTKGYARFCNECRPKFVYSTEDRKVQADGYVFVRVEGRMVAEHRYVLSQKLGRPLRKGESAHHKNGDRADNRPDNLELWVKAPRFGVRANELLCPHCGHSYVEEA